MKSRVACLAAAVVLGAAASLVPAAIVDPHPGGTVQTDEWGFASVIDSDDYGTPMTTTAWTSPIEANLQGFNATFNKNSGFGYLSGSGAIYALAPTAVPNDVGAAYTVHQSAVLSGVKSVIFQLDITEALGYDFPDADSSGNRDMPLLSYTTQGNATQSLAADQVQLVSQEYKGTFPDPDSGTDKPVYRNTWLLRWDVSDENTLGDPMASFDVNWSVVTHTWMYNARLDQSTVVPEPASLGFLVLSGMILLARKPA